MKKKELIYRVRNTLKELGSDSLVSNKYIYNMLKSAAIFLLKRESKDRSDIYFQADLWSTLCIDMIKVPSTECLSIPNDCTIYRSKSKLPEYVENQSGFIYKSITSLDNSQSFLLTTPYIALTKSKLKFNPNKYVWIENNYLYSLNSYPKIKVVGIFLEDLDTEGKSINCSRLDDQFILGDYLVEPCVKMCLEELMLGKSMPYDNNINKNPNN